MVSAGNGFYYGEEQFYKMAKVNLMKNNVSCVLIAFQKSEEISSPMILLDNGLNLNTMDNLNPKITIYDCIENNINK